MSAIQSVAFFAILILVTLRTLLFRHIAAKISPQATAWAIGAGTTCVCFLLLPVAWANGMANFSLLENLAGMIAGLIKGILLTVLLMLQQHIIGRSMSATAYVFPVAVGGIAFFDYWLFANHLSTQGMLSIITLFAGGLFFSVFGHLSSMPTKDKLRFTAMIFIVIGFAGCDKIGIPNSGWYVYLLYTGLGNMISATLFLKVEHEISARSWVILALGWCVPELFFNFSLSGALPVSYGYFAISLRVPLLMLIAYLFYKEGHAKNQVFFGLLSIIGTTPLFFR